MTKIKKDYYFQEDVILIAKDLIGKVLCTNFNNQLTCGIITETEAYAGITDKASHAYNNKRTLRNQTMYHEGGVAYIYLCYGLHHMFNVVTNQLNIPDAVLIRGIQPFKGIETMLERRNKLNVNAKFSSGPATLTQALGIKTIHNGISLFDNTIWLEDINISVPKEKIISSPRIGVSYAQEDALLPYNFKIIEKFTI